MISLKIISVKPAGQEEVFSIEMRGAQHNYLLSNGLVSKNSHSYSYSYISYWTAWMKANRPIPYMAALCSVAGSSKDKDGESRLTLYLHECRRMGMKIYPPHINESMSEVTPMPDGVRIGFDAIKGISNTARFVGSRPVGGYSSLYNFVQSSNPDLTALRGLIGCGALDDFGPRRGMMVSVETIIKGARKDNKKRVLGEVSLFDDDQVQYDIPNSEYSEYEKVELEKEHLDFYLSGHPLDNYTSERMMVADLLDSAHGDRSEVLLLVERVTPRVTKKGDRMAKVVFSDQTATIEALMFPKTWEAHGSLTVPGSIFKSKITTRVNEYDEKSFVVNYLEKLGDSADVKVNTGVFGLYVPKGFVNDQQFMGRLRGIAASHRGDKILVVYTDRSVTRDLGYEFLVSGDERMKAEVKALFSEWNSNG